MSNTKQINALSAAIGAAIGGALAPVLVAHFGGGTAPADEVEEEEESSAPKRGRGRPKKAEAAPAPKTEPKPAKVEEEDEDEDDGLGDEDDGLGEEEEEEITQEDVIAAFRALKASKGVEKCREVLAKIGESNTLNIPAKKFAEAMKEIKRAGSKK